MTYDPYTPPAAVLAITPKKSTTETLLYFAKRTLQGLLIIALVVMWLYHLPHRPISEFIGAHFPWPNATSRMLKWSALFIESTIIQIVLCLPVAGLLAVVLRRAAAPVAILLALIFVFSGLFELGISTLPQHQIIFDIWILLCHAVFLVTGTVLAKKRLDRIYDNKSFKIKLA